MTQSALSPLDVSQLNLDQLNRKFERAYPREILAWCVLNIPTGLVQISAFNIDELMITDILYRTLKPSTPVPILFIDTLHHFPQTLMLVKYAQEIYDLNLKKYKISGVKSRSSFAAKYGKMLWEKNLAKYHYLTKVQPLQRGLKELNTVAWISGQCRDPKDDNLTESSVFEFDEHKRLKINPLIRWTRLESWAYAYEHDMIHNPLHDEGYSDIGDEPLTFPVESEIIT